MIDLDEAWRWYSSIRESLLSFARLGRKHWDSFPDESPLWRDDSFRSLDSEAIIRDSDLGLEHLDDFAVMVFFSVFESIVRDRVIKQAEQERGEIRQELLIGLINTTLHDLRKKSFYRVLGVFKTMDVALVEQVNQVRRYRNWVAHGRRTTRPDAVDPATAYNRLKRFLDGMIRG
jgi:hypothetical protein